MLGGGGVAGIAWMTGLLAGLAAAGNDVTRADLVVGTSAGSTVAAQLGSGLSLDELYARQVDPALQTAEIDPGDIDFEAYAADMTQAIGSMSSETEARAAIGRLAMAARTVPEADRRAVIEARLPSHEWPSFALKIVAVDAETGETRVFGNDSGVGLVDAVAASCAVPGVWPTVTIGDRRYVDGGVRTIDNADLAAGHQRVVILLPLGTFSLVPSSTPFDRVVAELNADVTVISPDEASLEAIGANPLNPETRAPAAKAGRAQAQVLAL
nr:Phospholipase, patatin family protein [Kibdelosporangium sp. MJ126-NF4]CTQ89274.1 Phospholipase, patatin family protein [Kibdelosporangium sp. MJ126-NF4]